VHPFGARASPAVLEDEARETPALQRGEGRRRPVAGSGDWRPKLKADHPPIGKRPAICVCFASALVIAVTVHPAAARHAPRHASHGPHKQEPAYTPPYAAIVLDANSGNVLLADKADEPRHPASLTKIMTLYLLFEKLDAGKIRLDTQIPVSEHASVQAPTKLGLRPGETIAVEDAIQAMATKSANDAAVAVAEAIGGSERDFADMMTLKAHALGMRRTLYRNASGLPNDEQVTTARDQALLGRAIQERFPRYAHYFAMLSFTYHGEIMRNHNHLLGHVEGMDGIKTGYTEASGFNLIASVRRNNRHIVSVVMGGTSAGARDARMRGLIEAYIVAAAPPQKTQVAGVAGSNADALRKDEPRAAKTRTAADPNSSGVRAGEAPLSSATYSVASASDDRTAPSTATSGGLPAPESVGAETMAPTPTPYTHPQSPPSHAEETAAAATAPIKPIHVKTVKVKMAPAQVAALAPAPSLPAPARAASRDSGPPTAATPAPASEEPPRARDLIAETIRATTPPESTPRLGVPSAPPVHSGWIIQVGAFDAEREARERLNEVQAKIGQKLKHANPFTEAVVAGDKTLYRARFAGIQKDEADAICRQLKRNDISCIAIKN
jgi:D-alanyl-D-alanine carboxypeptidase